MPVTLPWRRLSFSQTYSVLLTQSLGCRVHLHRALNCDRTKCIGGRCLNFRNTRWQNLLRPHIDCFKARFQISNPELYSVRNFVSYLANLELITLSWALAFTRIDDIVAPLKLKLSRVKDEFELTVKCLPGQSMMQLDSELKPKKGLQTII